MRREQAIKAALRRLSRSERQAVLDALRGPLPLDDIPAATRTTLRQVVGVYLLNAVNVERAVLRAESL